MIIHLGYPLPNTSSGTHQAGQEKDQPLSLDLAPNRGLPSQHLSMLLVRSYRTFAPLPNSKLGDRLDLPTQNQAVCFCGTLLTITRTGRYPAGLIFREPGLSSNLTVGTYSIRFVITCAYLSRL